MENLRYLSDVIGPRLSGSPAMRRANEWTAERFRSYGLAASLEPYDFGVTWERGPALPPAHGALRPGDDRPQLGLDRGTGGKTLHGAGGPGGPVHPRQLRGVQAAGSAAPGCCPKPRTPVWNPDAPRHDAGGLAAHRRDQGRPRGPDRRHVGRRGAARRQYQIDLPYMLKEAGALGTLVDGAKEHALMTMSGSPNRVAPLPNIVISHEDYTLLERLIAHGVTPRLEGRVENKLGKSPVQQWNTVGEIRGSELPGQVVILGAHLDSWDLGTGVTDNGAGSMVVLEAARALAQSGLKPKRTIRFILFSGRGAGAARLAAVRGGARGRGGQHPGGPGDRQRYGTDRGTGAAGTAGVRGALAGAARSGGALGADSVRERREDGHRPLVASFRTGFPGSTSTRMPRGYYHTHHSQSDTYDKAVAERPEAGERRSWR